MFITLYVNRKSSDDFSPSTVTMTCPLSSDFSVESNGLFNTMQVILSEICHYVSDYKIFNNVYLEVAL